MLVKKINFNLSLIIIFIFLFSCKSIDENRIYTTIIPELIEITSEYEPDKSNSPVKTDTKIDFNKESFLLIEFDPKNPPDIKKILNSKFSNVVLSLPFEKKENTVLNSFQKNNNIMAMDKNEFHLWISEAKTFSLNLQKRKINVHLAINVDVYRFNYRKNIPLFYSSLYNTLNIKGKKYFHEYIIEFNKYLIEKLHIKGIILQNAGFLSEEFLSEYVNEIRKFSGVGFFIAFFGKGDNLAQENLFKIGADAIIDYSFSNAIAECFLPTGSFAKLSRFYSVENLYKHPEKHIIFASIAENGIKNNSLKEIISHLTLTGTKIAFLHADPSFFEIGNNTISRINNFKRKYLKDTKLIEIFKSDDVYAYVLTTGNNELFVILNKSNKRFSNTLFLRTERNILSNSVLRDIAGGPPLTANNGNVSVVISPENARVFYIRSNDKLRTINSRFTEVVSYSLLDKDIRIIRFAYRPNRRVKTVHLVGDFNNWDFKSLPMIDKNNNGVYEIEVPIPPGRYGYKILLDGVILVADHNARDFMDDGNNGKKSVIVVR